MHRQTDRQTDRHVDIKNVLKVANVRNSDGISCYSNVLQTVIFVQCNHKAKESYVNKVYILLLSLESFTKELKPAVAELCQAQEKLSYAPKFSG